MALVKNEVENDELIADVLEAMSQLEPTWFFQGSPLRDSLAQVRPEVLEHLDLTIAAAVDVDLHASHEEQRQLSVLRETEQCLSQLQQKLH